MIKPNVLAALILAVCATAGADAAHAQSAARPGQTTVTPKPDPLAVLRPIYASIDKPRETEPFSKRLMALYEAASKRSKELNEPVSGIDFDYAIDGQDYEPETAGSVRYQVLARSAAKASIKVTFRNGTPRELRYEMVFEGGKWLIDDVRSIRRDHPWVYSAVLREGAKAQP